jgi:AhpC/TSA family/Two component regulator propeller
MATPRLLSLAVLAAALVDARAGGDAVPRGRAVVLNVWATWCEPCRAEMASLESLARKSAGVAVDAEGRVWFATEGGVSMLEGGRWRAWTHKDGLGAPNAANLPPSANTGLGTRSRHDLSVLAEGAPTYNPSYVFAIHVASDGSVWAGTWGGGVARFDGKAWKNYTAADGLAGNIVYSIAQDAGGALWFGTDKGVSRRDGTAWRSLGWKDGLLGDHVYALAVAPGGDVWAGTRGGVARIATRAPSPARK